MSSLCAADVRLVSSEYGSVRACVQTACGQRTLGCRLNRMCVPVFPDSIVRGQRTLGSRLNWKRFARVSNFVRSTQTWFGLKLCVEVSSLCSVNDNFVSSEDASVRVFEL